jgi:hypothetical protein
MPMWFIRLRDVVWSAVGSLVLAAAAIITAIVAPDAVALTIAFGSGAVSLALLAQRA